MHIIPNRTSNAEMLVTDIIEDSVVDSFAPFVDEKIYFMHDNAPPRTKHE